MPVIVTKVTGPAIWDWSRIHYVKVKDKYLIWMQFSVMKSTQWKESLSKKLTHNKLSLNVLKFFSVTTFKDSCNDKEAILTTFPPPEPYKHTCKDKQVTLQHFHSQSLSKTLVMTRKSSWQPFHLQIFVPAYWWCEWYLASTKQQATAKNYFEDLECMTASIGDIFSFLLGIVLPQFAECIT